MKNTIIFAFFSLGLIFCSSAQPDNANITNQDPESLLVQKPEIIVGAEQPEAYLNKLTGKKVGLVVNQSSLVKEKHLVDFLLENKISIVKIFALEHGFRGDVDRGGKLKDEKDEKTGIPIVPAYGNNRKLSREQLADVEIIVFDIQDAGARFFTYISSLHEIMEACATYSKPLLVLDRPNPLGDYVDGPVREPKFKSFVGMHAIPVVHGLTVAELAQMINGEKWLEGGKTCQLEIVKVKNYKHSDKYELPVKPSPNLPNHLSVRLYPSLCFFEGTVISIGRGTTFPFQVIGYPDPSMGDSLFIPVDMPGMQMDPEHEGKVCYGLDLRRLNPDTITFSLKYLIGFYQKFPEKDKFFNRPNWINLLAGNDKLLKQIQSGVPEAEIRASWKPELEKYKAMRKKYLLYEE
jgi:uncharacterized protein YbbC (DUF1343 family)